MPAPKVKCECGSIIAKPNMRKHQSSAKHIRFVNTASLCSAQPSDQLQPLRTTPKEKALALISQLKEVMLELEGSELEEVQTNLINLIDKCAQEPCDVMTRLKGNKSKNTCNEIKIKLNQILDSSCSNKIHTETILALPTLKDAHMYCKYNTLSGQFTGSVLEKYIKLKYKMIKNSASLCEGDLKCNKINFEIKTSNGGKENDRFNFVQLRLNHNCEYIFTAYHIDYKTLDNLGELYIFKISKENIKPLIVKYGGYAHGTTGTLGEITLDDLNNTDNSKEYALRPKYGDKCWTELLNYRINEIAI